MEYKKLLIPRDGEPGTHAIFGCVVEVGVTDADVQQKAITAVTKWVSRTTEGQEALAQTNGGFNIGDAVMYREELDPWFEAEGLLEVDIEISMLTSLPSWTFDTVLYKEATNAE